MYDFTEEQIHSIIVAIENILNQGRNNLLALSRICDEDYFKGRGKYPITALVYTGFDVGLQNIPGFTIHKIYYGKGRSLPELYNEDVVVQFYSDNADPCGSMEVKSKIEKFGKRFQIIQFTVSDNTYQLKKLIQISFDGFTERGRANIADARMLYQKGE